MNRNSVKVRLTISELQAFMAAYQGATTQMQKEQATEVYTDHELLLLEMAITMRDKLEKKHANDQQKYTLTWTSLEAMGVYQLWQRPFEGISIYGGVVVQKVFDIIHQKHYSTQWTRPVNKRS